MGAVEWFPFEDRTHVATVLDLIKEAGIPSLRTCISWADATRAGADRWFDFLLNELDRADIEVIPNFFYTPPSLARTAPDMPEGKTSFPPKRLEAYADFVGSVIERHGHRFEWVMLWNEPDNDAYWNWKLDPDKRLFAQMFNCAADRAVALGKRVVLSAWGIKDAQWLQLMHRHGCLQRSQAVGVHCFPGTWEDIWYDWPAALGTFRAILKGLGSPAQLWATEIGFSTWGSDGDRQARENEQVRVFDEANRALAEGLADRMYWYSVMDQHMDTLTDNALNQEGKTADIKAYHFGLVERSGRRKPLFLHWKDLNTRLADKAA